jgi:hypothetical protein
MGGKCQVNAMVLLSVLGYTDALERQADPKTRGEKEQPVITLLMKGGRKN